MIGSASEINWRNSDRNEVSKVVYEHQNNCRSLFTSWPPVSVSMSTFQPTPVANPAQVEFRNYTQEQKEILCNLTWRLVDANTIYSNTTSLCTWALLIFLERGPAKLGLTFLLGLINGNTMQHQYSMRIIFVQELTILGGLARCATFDVSQGYW